MTMAVKPILFNTDMVRAILSGKKIVTRRVMKPQTSSKCTIYPNVEVDGKIFTELWEGGTVKHIKQPYQRDDILWVRETWRLIDFDFIDTDWSASVQYKADMAIGERWHDLSPDERTGWCPSIHMPKEAARIWLRVTNVRVERLQDIIVDGINSEGVDVEPPPICRKGDPTESERATFAKLTVQKQDEYISTLARHTYMGWCKYADDLFVAWKNLWDSIIKPADRDRYGWAANPWVWVINFERCDKPNDDAG